MSGSVSLDGSANVTLNANVIGLTSQGNKTAISGTTVPSSGVRLYQVYNNGYPTTYGNLLSVKGGGAGELLLAWKNTNRIYYRSKSDVSTEEWQSWSTVAFLTDNVASATKLQTARTIWGQSFNGEKNIAGNLTGVGNIYASAGLIISSGNDDIQLKRNNVDSNCITLSANAFRPHYSSNGLIDLGTSTAKWRNLYANGNAYINGNVGIGLTTANYKLHVNGGIGSASITTGIVETNAYVSTALSSENLFKNAVFNSIHAGTVNKGDCHCHVLWKDVLSGSGYTTRYAIGSIREPDPQWGRMYFGVTNNDAGTSFGALIYLHGKGQVEIYANETKANGNILATGGITQYSDQRAKTIIEQITLSLKDIAQSPAIRFKWNGWKQQDDGKTHIGGIAQYVQRILPEAIYNTDGAFTMDYAITGYIFAVNTAKHLLSYESKTDKEIKKLKKRIVYLENKLKSYEGKVI